MTIEAVIFDLDGVPVDSEHVWDEVREELARERGGRVVSGYRELGLRPAVDPVLQHDTARRFADHRCTANLAERLST